MPWRRRNRGFCYVCERPVSECGSLSARGKCAECGEGTMLAEVSQLKAHNGPHFDHWRRRTLAAFGVTVDTPEQ